MFGRIAANHALGDCYAMGARPTAALALAVLPYAAEAKVIPMLDATDSLSGRRVFVRRIVGIGFEPSPVSPACHWLPKRVHVRCWQAEEDLVQVMAGALSTLSAAGCDLVGGHTCEGADLALGFSVTVRPDRYLGNQRAHSRCPPWPSFVVADLVEV